MFVWNIEAGYPCKAHPEIVWKLMADPKSWPEWDDTLEWVHFKEPFQVGSHGIVKVKDANEYRFGITRIEKRRFSTVMKRFLTTIVSIYEIESMDHKSCSVHQRIIVGGLFAPFLRRTLAKKLAKSLPKKVKKLIHIAEKHV